MARTNKVLRAASVAESNDDTGGVTSIRSRAATRLHPLPQGAPSNQVPHPDHLTKPKSASTPTNSSPRPTETLAPLTAEISHCAPVRLASATRSYPLYPPPPRGYLYWYHLKKMRARSSMLAHFDPPPSHPQRRTIPSAPDLMTPFRLAQAGGPAYICYLLITLGPIALTASLCERLSRSIFGQSGLLWELPLPIAPFFLIATTFLIRTIILPVAFGIFAAPLRSLHTNGSLDLVSLIETTPCAVKRCCSTGWLVALKLARRLLVVLLLTEALQLLVHTESAMISLLCLTMVGACTYALCRATLLCAPLLAIVGDYGRRYAINHCSRLLQPAAQHIRITIILLVTGWFLLHLVVRTLLEFLGFGLASTVFWINAAAWSWYGITYLSSLVISYCPLPDE